MVGEKSSLGQAANPVLSDIGPHLFISLLRPALDPEASDAEDRRISYHPSTLAAETY